MKKIACIIFLFAFLTGCQNDPKKLHTQDGKRAEIHYQLGLESLRSGNLPKAFKELSTAEMLAPKRSDILDALGVAWRIHGDYEKAEAMYIKAVKQNKPGAKTYVNFGSLLIELNRPQEAETYIRQALEDPFYQNPDLGYITLGDALMQQERLADALQAYKRAERINPRETISRLRQASVYIKEMNYLFAEAIYDSILRDLPSSREAIEGLVNIRQQLPNQDKIRSSLKQFRYITPNLLDRAWADSILLGNTW